MAEPPLRHANRARIRDLDALRGFAICGIMLVNMWQHAITHRKATSIDWVMGNLFQGRFYPIFAFLFGMGCALFLDSARARTSYTRLVLLRRLGVLALFGVIHWSVNPGEVLLPYAILGVVVLLPASFLPPVVVLLLGVGTTIAAMVTGNPWVFIAGLFPLGMAVVRYGGENLPVGPGTFVVTSVLAVALTWWWNNSPPGGGVYQAAGLCGAVAYATGFLLPARASRRVARVFEPLGRMALTNYLTGTVVILTALPLLTADGTGIAVIGLSVVTLVVQAAFCRWWLARHRHGPLEWIWRSLTWWEPLPNGQTCTRDSRSTVPDPDRSRPEDEPGNHT